MTKINIVRKAAAELHVPMYEITYYQNCSDVAYSIGNVNTWFGKKIVRRESIQLETYFKPLTISEEYIEFVGEEIKNKFIAYKKRIDKNKHVMCI